MVFSRPNKKEYSDKDIYKLNKAELLEIMYSLSEENDRLHRENLALKQQLEDKNISIEEAGSIAEAALKLQDIFTVAQNAADLYLENVARIQKEKGNDA